MTGADLAELAERVGPVLAFLLAITVVAEISDLAGVFDIAAHWAARAGRGRVWALWLLIVAIACASTIILSLDTTAVLLTPVAITVARQVGVPTLPFAMTTLWLANTGSLLLPVSNLTNLLALHHFRSFGEGLGGYLALAWAPAVAAIAATVGLLALRHRRSLQGRYDVHAPPEPHDRTLLIIASVCCLLLGPLFVTGITPAIPAAVAAAVLVGAVWVRDRRLLRRVTVTWKMVLALCALFLVVEAALDLGLRAVITQIAGQGASGWDLARVGVSGAVTSNVVNNLPAYLVFESVASDTPARLMALLVGVNVGPLVTVWASLATVLWRQRCEAADLRIGTGYLAREGLLCAVLAVGAALGALVLVAT